MPTEFPDILAAWERRDEAQWEIGDKIIEAYGGRRWSTGINDDTLTRIKAELEKHGHGCEIVTLRQYRAVAKAFPNDERSSFPWSIYLIAGDQRTLARMQRMAGETTLTWRKARELKAIIDQARAEREAHRLAQQENAIREVDRDVIGPNASERAERAEAADVQGRAVLADPQSNIVAGPGARLPGMRRDEPEVATAPTAITFTGYLECVTKAMGAANDADAVLAIFGGIGRQRTDKRIFDDVEPLATGADASRRSHRHDIAVFLSITAVAKFGTQPVDQLADVVMPDRFVAHMNFGALRVVPRQAGAKRVDHDHRLGVRRHAASLLHRRAEVLGQLLVIHHPSPPRACITRRASAGWLERSRLTMVCHFC